jgi:peptidoglycan/xylan/chitin deacetylase (PgdA/CDA1 family)
MKQWLLALLLLLPCLGSPALAAADFSVPILLYHRFGPVKADSMTITTPVFAAHLAYLKENGFTVIPLRRLIDHYQGRGPAPAPKSVVIVADDAHRSVYTEMLPLVQQYRIPVTLFTYPSAISNASYAMTWDQLREVKGTGLFDIQSHTYWHPNLKQEKRKLAPAEYNKLVTTQLTRSKARLEQELGGTVDLLAWPFGIYDQELLSQAIATGYVATFSIEARPATAADKVMILPRYLLTDAHRGDRFARIVASVPRPLVAEAPGEKGAEAR